MSAKQDAFRLNVALVGLGYWGPKVLRNFLQNGHVNLLTVCDQDQQKLDKIHYPGIHKTKNYEDIIHDPKIEAVILCVPIKWHYPLAQKALKAKKHVWVEKPLTDSVQRAIDLCLLSQDNGVVLFVDHTFLYNPAVQTMKKYVDAGELGEIYYFDSTRINLGLIQSDVNVVWDLAPHDISILNYLITKKPVDVTAVGATPLTHKLAEIAYVYLTYENGMVAHFNFNWLSPVKIRKIIVGGSKKLMVYDDIDQSEKIKIYEKGASVSNSDEKGKQKMLINYRMGDIVAPYFENAEPLTLACKDFVGSIQNNESPLSDGVFAVKVVQIIEAIQKSLDKNGQKVELQKKAFPKIANQGSPLGTG